MIIVTTIERVGAERKTAKNPNLKQTGQFFLWIKRLNPFKTYFLGQFLLLTGPVRLFERFFFQNILKFT